MKYTQIPNPSLNDLAVTTVRLGRELAGLVLAISPGREIHDREMMREILRPFVERNPFDMRDDSAFEALRTILEAELDSELIRMERQYFETHFDAEGQHGEVRECPVYTERGHDLLAALNAIASFMAARDAMLDHAAAARGLRVMLAP